MLHWSSENPRTVAMVATGGLAMVYYLGVHRRRHRLPPGPGGYPLVGSVLNMSDQWHLDFSKMKEKYGDVFTIYIGSK